LGVYPSLGRLEFEYELPSERTAQVVEASPRHSGFRA
jgi:hypothetical protein